MQQPIQRALLLLSLLTPVCAEAAACRSAEAVRGSWGSFKLVDGPTSARRTIIVIDKGADPSPTIGTLSVVDLQSGEVLARTRVGLGRGAGRKVDEGDKSTPEGLYEVLDRRETCTNLAGAALREERVGDTFLLLSYPNLDDRMHRRTGAAVGIHGGTPASHETAGCVKLFDIAGSVAAFADKWFYLDQRVLIVPEAAEGLRAAGKLHPCWTERLNDLASWNLGFGVNDRAISAVASECAPAPAPPMLASVAPPRSEAPAPAPPPPAAFAEPERPGSEAEVEAFVRAWTTAWEGVCYWESRYTRIYHPTFRAWYEGHALEDATLDRWMEHKRALCAERPRIALDVSRLAILEWSSETEALLGFCLNYTATGPASTSVHTGTRKYLVIRREAGYWQVLSEDGVSDSALCRARGL